MKIVTIMIFLVCIQVSIGTAEWMGVFNTQKAIDQGYINDLQEGAKGTYSSTELGEDDFGFWSQAREFAKAMLMFGKYVGKAIFLFPWVLNQNFGVPFELSAIIGGMVGVIQVIGIIQFLRGFAFPSAQ